MPIRVFLVSDFRLMLKGIETLLAQAPGRFAIAGTAASYEQAVQSVATAQADIVLLDVEVSPDRVLAALNSLRAVSETKVLLLARQADNASLDEAIVGGARGVIDRDADPASLFSALEKVHEGQIWLDRAATGRVFVQLSRLAKGKPSDPVAAKVERLTAREQEIVAAIARNSGEPSKAIARVLHISDSTLRNHLTSIYEKLGVPNRNGLLAYAYKNRLVEGIGQPATL